MKPTLTLIVLLLLVGGKVFGQDDNSDLYIKIDSIITYEIEYSYDSTTDKLPTYKWDSAKVINPTFSTLPPNPSPLIILDGNLVKHSELNNHRLKEVAQIDVYRKNDKQILALYGVSGKNGVIIIQTKKFYKQKKKQ